MATVTNYHEPDGLQQHKCILSEFWRPEDQNHYHYAKIKVKAGAMLILSLWGEINSVSLSFLWLLAFLSLYPYHPNFGIHGHIAFSSSVCANFLSAPS